MKYRYLGQVVAGVKFYAGTGMLACRNGEQLCRLYYRLGRLTHAQLGQEVGAIALARLLGWADGEIEFLGREEIKAESLQAGQEETFLQVLQVLVTRGILESWNDQELKPLSAPSLNFGEEKVISTPITKKVVSVGEIKSNFGVVDEFEEIKIENPNRQASLIPIVSLTLNGSDLLDNLSSLENEPELEPVNFDFELSPTLLGHSPPVKKSEEV